MSWRQPAALDRHRTWPDALGSWPRLTAAPIVTPDRVAGRDAQSNPRQPSSQLPHRSAVRRGRQAMAWELL